MDGRWSADRPLFYGAACSQLPRVKVVVWRLKAKNKFRFLIVARQAIRDTRRSKQFTVFGTSSFSLCFV